MINRKRPAACSGVHALVVRHPLLFVVVVLFVRKRSFVVVVLGLFSSVPLLLDLARYEFGKIVEGLLNLGCRNVFVQRGLKAFVRQGFGRRFVALGGKRR